MAMNKGAKIGLAIGVLVILGVGGYFGYKMLFKPKKEEEDDIVITDISGGGSGSGSGSGSGGSATSFTFPFKTTEEGNKFRAWINTNYSAYAKEIDLDVTGALNKFVEKAWLKYGTEYTKSLNVKSPTTSTNTSSDIKTIQGFAIKGSGIDKSTEAYLKSANQNFVKKWASKIKANKSAFEWNNKVYRTKTGNELLNYNPLTSDLFIKDSGQNLRDAPNTTSTTSYVSKGKNLGKGGDFSYDGTYLYIYLPQEKRWINAQRVSKTKLSFSGEFDGFMNVN